MKAPLLLLLIFVNFQLKAQLKNEVELLKWLNNNSVGLNENYFSKLAEDLKLNKVLGLGEASHGTREFYLEKNKIVKYLIENKQYSQIGFEFKDSILLKINDYVSGAGGELKNLMKDMRLYNTQEFYDLFEWIKNYNAKNFGSKISVFGFDETEFLSDPFTRDSLMANNIIERQRATKQKVIVWGHNLHVGKYGAAILGATSMGKHLNNAYAKDYFNIAFDTYEGFVNTIMNKDEGFVVESHELEKPTNNFTAIFAKSNQLNFYVNMAGIHPFSDVNSTFTNIYADWRKPFNLPVKFDQNFNALIFVKKTSASSVLKKD